LRTYRADLHVHTVLSPCAEVEMIPPLIVREAVARGLALLAITDHNASANVAAVQQAAQGWELAVLPGLELQTREDVHVLCLFDRPEQLGTWQARVSAGLPDRLNDAELFGEQFVVDATGEFVRRETRLLLTAAQIGLDEAVKAVTALGGLAIPAHVDRPAFGLLAHLGFVPTGLPIEALEISRRVAPEEAQQRFPQISGYRLVQNGDAHGLDEIWAGMALTLEAPTVAEIRMALRGEQGRRVTLQVDRM
jgi:predicted metal-dependent phosphoesterase TrpH